MTYNEFMLAVNKASSANYAKSYHEEIGVTYIIDDSTIYIDYKEKKPINISHHKSLKSFSCCRTTKVYINEHQVQLMKKIKHDNYKIVKVDFYKINPFEYNMLSHEKLNLLEMDQSIFKHTKLD